MGDMGRVYTPSRMSQQEISYSTKEARRPHSRRRMAGKSKSEIEETDPVRRAIVARMKALGLEMKPLSLRIGQNETYLQQFLRGRRSPKVLPELIRRRLESELGVSLAPASDPPNAAAAPVAPPTEEETKIFFGRIVETFAGEAYMRREAEQIAEASRLFSYFAAAIADRPAGEQDARLCALLLTAAKGVLSAPDAPPVDWERLERAAVLWLELRRALDG